MGLLHGSKSFNPQAAASVVEGVYAKSGVAQFSGCGPYRYRQVEESEIRILLRGHYRIAYLHRQDNASMDILGVFHDALDIDRYFP